MVLEIINRRIESSLPLPGLGVLPSDACDFRGKISAPFRNQSWHFHADFSEITLDSFS
jgi:hypothetical protein